MASPLREELGRKGSPLQKSTEVRDGKFFEGTRRKIGNANGQAEEEGEREEGLVLHNHQRFPQHSDLLASLKACAKQKDLHEGSRLHAHILKWGLLEEDIYVGNTLVHMYAQCGALAKAQEVFDELRIRDVVSWNVLITGYSQQGHSEKALSCFERMQREGFSPNAVTFVCGLKACGNVGAVDKGKQIHAEIVREGLLERDIYMGAALVDMYAKCGALAKAQEVFDDLQIRDVVSWTALIGGYAQHGQGEEALNRFSRMQHEGLSPNTVTLVCILKACASIGAGDKGKEIHAEIIKERLGEKDVLVGTALVDMYAKCGALEEAQEVFDELGAHDAVSWSVLVAGYLQHGHGDKAVNCFQQMQLEGFSPNRGTLACILKACGSIGAADKGREIHAEIVGERLLENDILIGTALVDMYAKCGAPEKAQKVFDQLPVRDVVSWTALIVGYAQHGHGNEALECFERVQREGLCPDSITFSAVLNACSHSGLLEKGLMYFENMQTSYGITATLEHFTCMVDLFSRAGHFDKAVGMIKKMPASNHLPVWTVLLNACQKWGNLKLARLAFENAVCLDEKDASVYICMSNIYATAFMQEDADKIEAMRVKNKAWKRSQCG